jgi:hypothetical protein
MDNKPGLALPTSAVSSPHATVDGFARRDDARESERRCPNRLGEPDGGAGTGGDILTDMALPVPVRPLPRA